MTEDTTKEADSPGGEGSGRHRSPSYPVFDLPEAIQRLKKFFDTHKRHSVTPQEAILALGYKNVKSSEASRSLSAMVGYGLLDEVGKGHSRMIKLSNDGYKLAFILQPGDPEIPVLLREAALRQPLYRRLVELYDSEDGLPHDSVLNRVLRVQLGFNPSVVNQVIRDFRSTYEYANLGKQGILSADHIDKPDGESPPAEPPGQKPPAIDPFAGSSALGFTPREPAIQPPPASGSGSLEMPALANAFDLPIPLSRNRFVILRTPSDISEKEYDRIATYLANNREAILEDLASAETEDQASAQRQPVPRARFGPAIWRSKDADHPVVVTGIWGEKDGRVYVSTEGSNTGTPLDEIVYEDEE